MVLVILGCVIALALIIAFVVPERTVTDRRVQVTGGGYPVPPLDLAVPKQPPRRRAVRERRTGPAVTAAVPVGAGGEKEADNGDV